MAILDLSKYAMYDFYYNYLKKKYGDKIQLQMTDTDSFLYHVQTDDLYADMKENLHLFDTANYPKDHFLYSKVNDKRLNKMKDETQSVPVSKFVGLRPKMYAYVCGGKEDKRAKGISKVTVKNNLSYQMYEETLLHESRTQSKMNIIRSHAHSLFCEEVTKTSLSSFCEKRDLLNNIQSVPYGHKCIKHNK